MLASQALLHPTCMQVATQTGHLLQKAALTAWALLPPTSLSILGSPLWCPGLHLGLALGVGVPSHCKPPSPLTAASHSKAPSCLRACFQCPCQSLFWQRPGQPPPAPSRVSTTSGQPPPLPHFSSLTRLPAISLHTACSPAHACRSSSRLPGPSDPAFLTALLLLSTSCARPLTPITQNHQAPSSRPLCSFHCEWLQVN